MVMKPVTIRLFPASPDRAELNSALGGPPRPTEGLNGVERALSSAVRPVSTTPRRDASVRGGVCSRSAAGAASTRIPRPGGFFPSLGGAP